MIVVILCGGSGTRMEDYSFPKPLNMINAKPAIYYTVSKIPKEIKKIHFIVAPHLHAFNFCEIVTNLFKDRECVFHNINYFTRGALETAFLGIQHFEDSEENIVFLDNDVVYSFPDNFFNQTYNSAFLGYSKDDTNSESYSFLKINSDHKVIEYKEKNAYLICIAVVYMDLLILINLKN